MSTTLAASLMAMVTDDALLQLIWLASPALPIGGFSYSEGMESAVDAGLVTDEESAALWLVDQLHLSLARAELAVAAQAFHAWQARDLARVRALDAWVLHTRETSEQRQQTEQMGRSLVEWLRGVKPAALETMQEMHETQEKPALQTGPDSVHSAPTRATFHLCHN